MGFFSKPVKQSRSYKGFFGDRVTETRYNDTGKVVKTVSRPGIFGGTVSSTYLIKPGHKGK